MKSTGPAQRVLHFRVADRAYCIDATQVVNVMQGAVVSRDQVVEGDNSMPGRVGQIVFNDESLPVIRLRSLFDEGASAHSWDGHREHVIIASTKQGRVALLVDLVHRASHVRPENLVALPRLATSTTRPYFCGVVRIDGQSTSKLESSLLESLLNEESETPGDRRTPALGRRAALLVSPNGLLGDDSENTPLADPPLDIQALLSGSSSRVGQLMLFDVPQLCTVIVESKSR